LWNQYPIVPEFVMAGFSLSLKVRIAIIPAVLLTAFTVIGGFYIHADRQEASAQTQISHFRETQDVAHDLSFNLLDARRHEKDFQLAAIRKSVQEIDLHAKNISAVRVALNKLDGLLSDSADRQDLALVRSDVDSYAAQFAELVSLQKKVGLNEDDGSMGEFRTAVHEVEAVLKKFDTPRLQVLMLMMRRHEKDFLARLDDKYIVEMKKRGTEFSQALAAETAIPEDQKAEIAQKMDRYQTGFQTVATAVLAVNAQNKALGNTYSHAEPIVEKIALNAAKSLHRAESERDETHAQIEQYQLIVTIFGVLLGLIATFAVARSIYRPLLDLEMVMKRLSEDDLSLAIPHTKRSDEIGFMARAVEVFKHNAIETTDLRLAQERQREEAETQKRKVIQSMVQTIDNETAHAAIQVAGKADVVSVEVGNMAAAAKDMNRLVSQVHDAVGTAAHSAQAVAAATEELSSSIGEISSQVTSANRVSQSAVNAATEAQETIGQLSDVVRQISEVVGLINDIASQTNLLALNATIEAARAGEAGRGFAVVANEVKNLSNQTAKATEEVTKQINEIQSRTKAAVHAVAQIADSIREVDGISSSIAAAIEQQVASTSEIARNVSETTQMTGQIADHINVVSERARASEDRASVVAKQTAEVRAAVEGMRSSLEAVLRSIEV
jgi:methyl-accepting chemotaxis protein